MVSDSGDDIFESQRTTEMVKGEITIFHTQATKAALCSKFGRVTPNIKAAVLHAHY